jgi:hypothetical protein
MNCNKRKRLRTDQEIDLLRGEHPDTRSNAEWVKQMKDRGWNWEKPTKGQSIWKQLNGKI